MPSRLTVLLGSLAVLAAAGCVDPATDSPPAGNGQGLLQPSTFTVTVVDATREGSEPSVLVAPDGSIFICGPRSLGNGSDLWVSTDDGASFQYVGVPANSNAPLLPGPILRSGGGDLGGGDCDLAADAGGRVYLADLWGGGVSVASTTDQGATWRGVPASTVGAPMDRPWALGAANDEVYVTAAQIQGSGIEDQGLATPPAGGIWVARSTDGGQTFPQRVLAIGNENRLGLNSNLAGDDSNLYLMYTKKVGTGQLAVMVAVSANDGQTWDHRPVAQQAFFPNQCLSPLNIFPVVAADGVGGVYLAWVLQNPETDRADLFMASSFDSGETWTEPRLLTDREGTRAYPWIAARGPGQVGLVWYESNVTVLREQRDKVFCYQDMPSDAAWNLHYALVESTPDAPPTVSEMLVQPEPVHVGDLERPYAEVLQVRFTPDGRAATAYVADVPEGTARPMFAIQAP